MRNLFERYTESSQDNSTTIKTPFMLLLSVATCIAMLWNTASADSYKCADDAGNITYSDVPCSADHQQLGKTYIPDDNDPLKDLPISLVSKDDLKGRWTDQPGESFHSSWFFKENNVVYANKQGVTMTETYTLEDDQIVFHHKPGLWGDSAWSESVTILQHTGQTLVLQWGLARVTLYRPL